MTLLNGIYTAFKMKFTPTVKHTVDTNVVNDITCTRQNVITCVVIPFLFLTKLSTE